MNTGMDISIQATQDRILAIFKCFDKFCNDNKIPYFSLGGTLLGAVRHGGFIPWDDDIDVGIPREHYDRFITLAAEMPTPYRVESRELDSQYIYPYAKVYDTNSIVTEDYIEPFTRGLWIDVFPIDGTYESSTLQWAHFKSVKFINAMTFIKTRRYSPDPSHHMKTNAKRLLSLGLSVVPERMLHSTLEWLLRRRSPRDSTASGNLLGRWGKREIVCSKMFTPGSTVEFCDMHVQAPASAAAYLGAIYGDYMRLPPEHQRVSGHKFTRVDFVSSYMNP